MFRVHRSNRVERLVERLIEVVRAPAPGARPLDAEAIVVQGRGMERWLSMRLAESLGVWANPWFPFPRNVIRRLIELVLGEEAAGEVFEPETLTWVIAGLLPELLDRPGFAPIAGYVRDDPNGLRRITLAARIADTFDRYAVYRAPMLRGWEQGTQRGDWQAELWRVIVERHGRAHLAAKIRELARALERGTGPIPDFPSRLALFGISALPPLYVDAFAAIAKRIDVHLFLFSPSALYWGDLRSRRAALRDRLRDDRVFDDDALAREGGNPLLASLGRLGRDFQAILESRVDYDERGPELYEEPGLGSMLSVLQSDVLALRERGTSGESAPLEIREDDDSIAIHACHGARREVEVLHDQLLDLFERDPTLDPRDVIVMCPAIDEYAPYVDAVFGRHDASGRPKIPYRVADRTMRATDEVVDAFARLLDTVRGRMGAADVLDLLGVEVVRERFAVSADDLDLLRAWTAEAGIRWGVDEAHRAAELGVPGEANSWRFGLDRMMLGHALRAERGSLFAGVLPFEDAEGGEDLLGRFLDFCDRLCEFRADLHAPRSPLRWKDDLGAALGAMIALSRLNRDQHRRIRAALDRLASRAALAGFEEAVSLEVVRTELDRELATEISSGPFLAQGVTFCALVPMRSIPFRVVVLLGLGDDAFPRRERPLGFDRLAEDRRPGDRSARDDDRYLFLEALLSARDRLVVTYVGHGIRDHSEAPPSVVVSELLDVIGDSFRFRGGDPHDRIVVHHPLQPFSRRYFEAGGDRRLFSFDATRQRGAERLGEPRLPRPLFLRRPLPLPPAIQRVVGLEELVRFFENPVRSFVRTRLGLYLDERSADAESYDPIVPNALEQWRLGQTVIDALLAGEDGEGALRSLRAGGMVPHGAPGDVLLDDVRSIAVEVGREVAEARRGARLDPVSVDLRLEETRLTGVLRNLWPEAQVFHSYAKLGARQHVAARIRHLALCAASSQAGSRTLHVGRKGDGAGVIELLPIATGDAKQALAELLRLYWLGQTVPLPFFASTASAFVKARRKGGDAQALDKARGVYRGGEFKEMADSQDPHVQLAFGDLDPLGREFRPAAEGADDVPPFAELALRILGWMTDEAP